jgi:mono/diheme cytochrome c family protein
MNDANPLILIRRAVPAAAMLVLIGFATAASANPFPKGNAATGKKLHDPRCVSCHNSMFPDKNGTQLYSDEMFRKATNIAQLRGMIEFCNNRTKAGWFEEEIQHVGRYLNDNYYKFTK